MKKAGLTAFRFLSALYQSLDTRVKTIDWSVVCGNSRSNSNFDNINLDRRNVYINFLEYFCIFNEYYIDLLSYLSDNKTLFLLL